MIDNSLVTIEARPNFHAALNHARQSFVFDECQQCFQKKRLGRAEFSVGLEISVAFVVDLLESFPDSLRDCGFLLKLLAHVNAFRECLEESGLVELIMTGKIFLNTSEAASICRCSNVRMASEKRNVACPIA